MIRVCIADDQRLMRDGLQTLLALESDIQPSVLAADGLEAVAAALGGLVDVMLMDIRMPTMDGIEAVRRIRAAKSDVRILMLTTYDDSDDVLGALSAGAQGYLLKDMPADEIAAAIRTVYTGGAVLPPHIANTLLHHVQSRVDKDAMRESPGASKPLEEVVHRELTDREREVLHCLAEGLSNREIAGRLFVTEGTVKNHVSSLIAKLGLRDRTQVALFAVRHGFGQMYP
ncbi:response regulator transcription factor [Alicyclobacillus curvatus]|nr:response regulator transcription factor [Alicyclobacillus curvatus]